MQGFHVDQRVDDIAVRTQEAPLEPLAVAGQGGADPLARRLLRWAPVALDRRRKGEGVGAQQVLAVFAKQLTGRLVAVLDACAEQQYALIGTAEDEAIGLAVTRDPAQHR